MGSSSETPESATPPVLEYGRPVERSRRAEQFALETARIITGLVLLPILLIVVFTAAAGIVWLVMDLTM